MKKSNSSALVHLKLSIATPARGEMLPLVKPLTYPQRTRSILSPVNTYARPSIQASILKKSEVPVIHKFTNHVKANSFAYAVLAWLVLLSITVFLMLCEKLPAQQESIIGPVEPEVIEVVQEEPELTPYYASIAEAMTDEEMDLLKKVVYLESNDQTITGQKAVVEVIFNRVLHPDFPDTVRGVLTQKGQFSTISILHKAKPNAMQTEAIEGVLTETVPMMPNDVVYFATYHANGTFYERIGDHYFGRG